MQHNTPKVQLTGIDALRGYASVVIVMFHIVGIPNLTISENLQFIKSYFGLAVTFFFVISSFSLFLGNAKKYRNENWLRDYFLKRFFRIAPLFYTMIVVYFIFNIFVWDYFCTIPEILINITFVFNLIPGKHEGIAWASWFIGVLSVFYMIFPFLIATIRNITVSVISYFLLAGISSCANLMISDMQVHDSWKYMNVLNQLGVFAFGIPVYFLYNKLKHSSHKNAIAYSLFCGFIVIWAVIVWGRIEFKANLWINTWSVAFGILILSQALLPARFIAIRPMAIFGRFSYSVYLCHPVLIYLLKPVYAYVYGLKGFSISVSFAVCVVISFLLIVPVSYAAHRLVEINGVRLGKWIIKRTSNDTETNFVNHAIGTDR